MREGLFTLTETRVMTPTVRLLRFEGDSSAIQAPGQFVMLPVPDRFLRRPFSVCDWDEGWFTVLIDRVGEGTAVLQDLPRGTELSVLTGLGHGFSMDAGDCGSLPLLIGGGTGLSPLVGLNRRLLMCGLRPRILLGFRNPRDTFGTELFPGAELQVAEDIFTGLNAVVHDRFFACGSEAMMAELCRREHTTGQVAFDVRMGCGFGACMGCSRKTVNGMKRVCSDGPVFRKEELLWDD